MKAFIGGTSLTSSTLFKHWDEKKVETPHGDVYLKATGQYVFLQRHGKKLLPPHMINHHANIWALRSLNIREVIAVNSVGSMKVSIKPGTVCIPDDFIAPWSIPTFYNYEMKFLVPELDLSLRDRLHTLCVELGIEVTLGGTYVQTTGPRLETKAEINFLRKFGDIVGMTMASEATLCMEYNLPYVSVCSVDNYCNGVMKEPLTVAQIQENARINSETLELLIQTTMTGGPL
jgi:5'-methylthioadenosine phosphorylase